MFIRQRANSFYSYPEHRGRLRRLLWTLGLDPLTVYERLAQVREERDYYKELAEIYEENLAEACGMPPYEWLEKVDAMEAEASARAGLVNVAPEAAPSAASELIAMADDTAGGPRLGAALELWRTSADELELWRTSADELAEAIAEEEGDDDGHGSL